RAICMQETMPHWLSKQAHLAPSRTAIELENGRTLSFAELEAKSRHFAKKLAGYGAGQGSHVGILSSNHVDMVIAIHALSYLGAVAVLLNTRLSEQELDYQINDAGVQLILVREHSTYLTVPSYSFLEISQSPEKSAELRKEVRLDDVFTIM